MLKRPRPQPSALRPDRHPLGVKIDARRKSHFPLPVIAPPWCSFRPTLSEHNRLMVSPALVNLKEVVMKIVVIGGTGLIGSRLVTNLRAHGHEAVAASPQSGVNSVTGDGLADALQGASAVIDVTNSPSWEDAEVLKFFEISTRTLLAYEAAEGVGHHIALSVFGTERLLESGFFRAKFVKQIVDFSTEGNIVHMPPAFIQPMAADDGASAVARIATDRPVNGTVEIGGPE